VVVIEPVDIWEDMHVAVVGWLVDLVLFLFATAGSLPRNECFAWSFTL